MVSQWIKTCLSYEGSWFDFEYASLDFHIYFYHSLGEGNHDEETLRYVSDSF